jgi:hypothetical protein
MKESYYNKYGKTDISTTRDGLNSTTCPI